MAENKPTVFQGLVSTFRKKPKSAEDASYSSAGIKNFNPSQPSIDPHANQTAQQQQFLDWQIEKIAHDLYNRTIFYDTDRLTKYNDFRAMDLSPEISTALNVMRDECLTRNERGNILEIYSENSRIKQILTDLFKNKLNTEFNLRLWIREMCKYGDFFLHLHIDKDLGVYNIMPLPVEEIHREEGLNNDPELVRFRWDSKNMYFEDWQIAHFRLIEDYRNLPYGRSMLEASRKLWKQLQLSEDAMLVYRITRAPERRIFYIEVGNIAEEDISQHIGEMRQRLKKQPLVNNQGQINYKYNPMNIEEDYFIPIRGDKASRIDTLPGAQNLDQIADIEYLQNKLFASIQVPKPYLNYAEAMPAGSALAQADIRFARTINTIQEAVLMELRRIANIHLYILGFQDDLDNFTLMLTNPSTQNRIMMLEMRKMELEVFKEMFTSDATSPVSYTWAMENILGFSKSEIKLILKQKKVERKLFAEIETAAETYKNIGLFTQLDKKFNKPGAENIDITAGAATGGDQDAGGAGGFDLGGGGGFGGASDLGLGGAGADLGTGGETADVTGGADASAPDAGAEAEQPAETVAERKNKVFKKLLKESEERFENTLDELLGEETEILLEEEKESNLLKNNENFKSKANQLFENFENRLSSENFEEKEVNFGLLKESKEGEPTPFPIFQNINSPLLENNNKATFETMKLIRSIERKLNRDNENSSEE